MFGTPEIVWEAGRPAQFRTRGAQRFFSGTKILKKEKRHEEDDRKAEENTEKDQKAQNQNLAQ